MVDAGMSAPPVRYIVSLEGEEHEVVVEDGGEVVVDGRRRDFSLAATGGSIGHSLILDGESVPLLARCRAPGQWEIDLDGRCVGVEVMDERQARIREMSAAAAGGSGSGALKAPMPGLVVKVPVEEGQVVEAGATVVIVEAMKMENELGAPGAARVARILVAPGDAVEKAQILVEFSEVEAR